MAEDNSNATDATRGAAGDSVSVSELQDRLDSLWVAYLKHVEEYATAQHLLQKHTAKGFFSIARANFTARDGIRRFGKDFYHENAVASRRVDVASPGTADRPQISIVNWSTSESEDVSGDGGDEKAQTTEPDPDPEQQPSPPLTPAADSHKGDLDTDAKTDGTNSKRNNVKDSSQPSGKIPLAMDPLRWFGILVSPELRTVQKSFAEAVQDAVPTAANSAKAMREVEIEIRKLRKDIKRAEKATVRS